MKYQVKHYESKRWSDIDARSPSEAAVIWAVNNDAAHIYSGDIELDVKDDAGKLWEVSVDADTSYSAFAKESKIILK